MKHFVIGILAVCAGLVAAARDARADDTRNQAETRRDLEAYFAGERWAGFCAGGLGLMAIGGGAFAVLRGNNFVRGAGWALIGIGAIELIGGTSYEIVLHRTVPGYEAHLDRDPAGFRRDELTRMSGVVSRFTGIRWQDAAFAVVGAGIATYGFASRRPTWQGVGISISVQALALLALEEIDYHRAIRYQERLELTSPSEEPRR